MSEPMKSFPLKSLVDGLEVRIQGDENLLIAGVTTIQQAKPSHITFLNNPLYKKYLAETQAAAVICTEQDAPDCVIPAVITKNPYYVYAKVAAFFEKTGTVAPGIHETAVIGDDAIIHPSVSIGPNAVIGHHVVLGQDVVIGAGTYIGDRVSIGEGSVVAPRVTIYHDVRLGKRVRLASGVVIGADGFGFANHRGQWHKVPQLGGVVLGDDVDVGANTTIDRGALDDTFIGEGVKLDNLIQIGHNVRIGAHTIVAGCAAIAGSTIIGERCMVGGSSAFAGHLEVVDNVMMTGMTTVTKSIREPGMYSSGIVGAVPTAEFRKNNARFYRLENLMDRVKKLEAMISSDSEKK